MPETAGKGTTIFFCEITHGNLPFDLVWHGSKISWSLSILIIVWSFQSRCSRRLQNCPRITIKFLAFFFYSTVTLSSWVWKASCSLNKPMKHRKRTLTECRWKFYFEPFELECEYGFSQKWNSPAREHSFPQSVNRTAAEITTQQNYDWNGDCYAFMTEAAWEPILKLEQIKPLSFITLPSKYDLVFVVQIL